ncbi:MAG: hypothetical protein WC307_01375 [Candidatus Nanoarchaeia archaeon]|jgi:hypothetical protein
MEDLFDSICDMTYLCLSIDNPNEKDELFVNNTKIIIDRSVINYANEIIDALHDECSPVEALKYYFKKMGVSDIYLKESIDDVDPIISLIYTAVPAHLTNMRNDSYAILKKNLNLEDTYRNKSFDLATSYIFIKVFCEQFCPCNNTIFSEYLDGIIKSLLK